MPLRLGLDASATSGLLYRRRSSLKFGRRSSATLISKAPLEILEQIVGFSLSAGIDRVIGHDPATLELIFREYIGPYTLVSKDLRFLALRSFFRRLHLTRSLKARNLFDFLSAVNSGYRQQGWKGGYVWVRSLSSPHSVLSEVMKDLAFLTNLRSLTINMRNSGLMLQRTYIEDLSYYLKTADITHNITSLMLEIVPRIDMHLLTFIGTEFPELVELNISSSQGIDLTCCASCYEESLSRIVHSPIPDVFCDATSLANTFGRTLAPLKKLSRLFLGIYLSQTDLLDFHIAHGREGDMGISPVTVETVFDCSRCHKYRRETKERELLGAFVLARHLESIESISWSSCFSMRTYDGRRLEHENFIEGSEWDISYGKPCSSGKGHDIPTQPKANFQELRTDLIVDKGAQRIKVMRVL